MKIAITRDEQKAAEFIRLVKSIGLDVIPLEVIKLIPDNKEIERLKDMLDNEYDYILFMSANAVDMLKGILDKFRGKEIIAVGPKTRSRLEANGIDVSLMPRKYSSYGIVELLSKMDVRDKRILIPRSAAANSYLKDELERLGMIVHEVRFYNAKPNKIDKEEIKDIDCIIFTSASNVHAFFENIDDIDASVIAIGPFTDQALKEHNIDAIVADEHTIEGIFKEIKKMI